jgi:hypothetical protein
MVACGSWSQGTKEGKGDQTRFIDRGEDSSGIGPFAAPREGATLVPPVHLEPDILRYLAERAAAQGISLNALVNTLLQKDIELIEAGR